MVAYRDELIERTLGGRYRLLDAVGVGASATVYLAEDAQLSRHVAVKVLHRGLADDPSFLRRFRAEAQAAAALSHPNILAVFDWGEDGVAGAGGLPYLVTEYLAGGSLRSMLDRGRRLSPSQALLVGLETGRGLDYAHRRGVVHRDVKPANLLFGDDGRLRIADFGLARAIAEATWTEPSGVVLGTARYTSPEQAKGQPVDGKTDVYSLVLTLVEAVTGSVPFAGETTVATLMNRLDKLLPVSAELSHLAPVLERAGRPWPDERSDAAELVRGLVYAAERLPRPAPLPLVRASVPSATERAREHLVALATTDVTDIAGRTALAPGDGPPPVDAASNGASTPVKGSGGRDGVALRIAPDAFDSAMATPNGASASPVAATAAASASAASAAAASAAAAVGGRERAPSVADGTFDDEGDDASAGDGRRNRGRRLALWLVLAVLAGLAAATVAVVGTRARKTYTVDDYVGQPAGSVKNTVEGVFDWHVDETRAKSDQFAADTVIGQEPPPGVTLRRGATLHLVVSDGAPMRPLPDVTGKTKDEATKILESAGLKADVADPDFDETMVEGSVLRWTVGDQAVAANTDVAKGVVVTLTLSKGPKPRTRPTLKDMTWDQAKAAIEALQLVPARTDEYSDTVVAGVVVRADPPIGADVARNGTVNIVISKGPELFAVPDLKGHTPQEAETLLAGANLKSVVEGSLGNVVAQSPAPGQMVPRGTKVTVTLG